MRSFVIHKKGKVNDFLPFGFQSLRNASTMFVWLISHQPTILFSHNKPATINQSVIFFHNKSAPATTMRLVSFSSPFSFVTTIRDKLNNSPIEAACSFL
jgi:hypothetical protein